MADRRDFDIWVERDRIRVRFVRPAVMGRTVEGHSTAGDFTMANRLIRIHRGLTLASQRATVLHELGHYLYKRMELAKPTEEDVVDLLAWLPEIMLDARNRKLVAFLGLSTRA